VYLTTMARLIPFLILIIDILVIVDILKSDKDNEKKVLWIIAVVFLPVLGPLLYFFLGKGR
jgi:RsiW-degrading membrane proteinase PrsW (M82 family)